jgi:isocitrate dehydrogenase (NAD+)
MAEHGTPLPEHVLESIRRTGSPSRARSRRRSARASRASTSRSARPSTCTRTCARPAPCKGVESRYEDVDLVIVRENTEDLYAGIEHMVGPDAAESIKIITRAASERIARFAFDYAVANGRRKVTAVHKANIMKLSDGLFLESCRNVARDYEGRIEFEDRIVDNMCMQLVQKPELYDVLVLPNLYGDIVSDLAAGLVGGLGVAPGANIGTDAAVFEPVHGSAPKYAGQDKANPTALILSGALMLRHLGHPEAAERVEAAAARGHRRGHAPSRTTWAGRRHERLRRRNHRPARRVHAPPPPDLDGRAATHRRFHAPSVSRGRGDARLGVPPDLRGRHLGVRRAPRRGHLPRRRQPGAVRRGPRHLREPPGIVDGDAPRRGAPLPRAQRPADHHHGLLARDDPLPPAASGT